jgi:hypothetical protein
MNNRSLTSSLAMQRRTNPARAARAALLLCLFGLLLEGNAQGLNNLWLGGYQSWAGSPYGGVTLDFTSGSLVIDPVSRDVDFFRTNTNMSDANGNLLFATNGTMVANAMGDTMLNGSGLNPGTYADLYPEGLYIAQGVLALPQPNEPNVYYLLHMTIDNSVVINAEHLLLTTIDMSLDGGLGGVVSKNISLLNDELNLGHLTAVRHANGRDWWALCHKLNTNTFYRFLVTPSGIVLDGMQSIGMVRPPDSGQVCFSPDGSKFAYYWRDHGLEVFPFDRCTGLFSAPASVTYTDGELGAGAVFSPNGRFLYITDVFNVYQYDTEAPNLAASAIPIAHWDSTYSPSPPFATLFDIAQLAPDGKIYIGTGNSTFALHVIHSPDSAGLTCGIEQHGITLPRYFDNSLPNHPNYHLGPVDGTVCDSLGINVGLLEQQQLIALHAFPNPSTGAFTLSYPAQPIVGELEGRDLSGRIVLRERIPQWSTVHRVSLDHSAAGLYMCRIKWQERQATVRVLVE